MIPQNQHKQKSTPIKYSQSLGADQGQQTTKKQSNIIGSSTNGYEKALYSTDNQNREKEIMAEDRNQATSSECSEFSDSSEDIDIVCEMPDGFDEEKISPNSRKQQSTDVSPSNSSGFLKNSSNVRCSFSNSSTDTNKSLDLYGFSKRSKLKQNTFTDLSREKGEINTANSEEKEKIPKLERKSARNNNAENFVCVSQEFKPEGLIKMSENVVAVSALTTPFQKPR